MSLLFKHWLALNENKYNRYIAVYSGRFQPFHKGHYETYKNTISQFGKNNVYIATSNKVELPKSPFNFKEKKQIITTLFNIPSDKIVQIKNPYNPVEIKTKYPDTYAYITIVGKKDADRLTKGNYFDLYEPNQNLEGYKTKGYVWVAPQNETLYNGKRLSGTMVREIFSNAEEDEKKALFMELYPKWSEKIFNLITKRIK